MDNHEPTREEIEESRKQWDEYYKRLAEYQRLTGQPLQAPIPPPYGGNPPAVPPKPSLFRRIWHVAWPPLLYLGIMYLVSFAAALLITVGLVLQESDLSDVSALTDKALETAYRYSSLMSIAAAAIGMAVLIPIYLKERRRTGENTVGADTATVKLAALLLPCAVGMYIILIYLVNFFFAFFPDVGNDYNELMNDIIRGQTHLFALYSVLFAPIIEEIVYRGFVQGRARRLLGPRHAIFISAAVFGAAHLSFSAVTLVQAAYAAALGILLGWVYERRRNIIVPIAMHMAFNASNYLLRLLPEDIPDVFLLPVGLIVAFVFLFAFHHYSKEREPI
ncbi:MAG: CPBP family intramembrane metalloprotease [Oscillospiraceae bacterium]|jgi:membrane protease YdiL (CAAX protease family)|nr:CPBP family intramembrane metalloprotease [Oscillospiraceae bacterium]